MGNYIERSACQGTVPKNLFVKNEITRNKLISTLMSQRDVLRLIIAPDSYGKSTLAKQYSELIFSFNKVFWINTKSPCFLRDLDLCSIGKQIVKLQKNASLVVFDGVGSLSEERLKRLSNEIDYLLNRNTEVIITTTPINKSIERLQPDCLCLKNEDLLLSKQEIDSNLIYFQYYKMGNYPKNFHIVSLLQGENNRLDFLKLFLEEDYPIELTAALFSIYVFIEGNLNFLEPYISTAAFDLVVEIAKEYGFFGITDNNNFKVINLDAEDIKSIFYSRIDSIVQCFGVTTRNGLGVMLYNYLLENKQYGRALQVARWFCNYSFKTKCLRSLNFIAIEKTYLNDACELFDDVSAKNNNDFMSTVYHAYRLGILGDIYNAIKFAYYVLDNNKSSDIEKLLALFVYLFFASEKEKSQCISLLKLYSEKLIDPPKDFVYKNDQEVFNILVSKHLSKTFLSIYEPSICVFDIWLKMTKQKISKVNIICAIAIFLNIDKLSYKVTHIDVMSKFLSVIGNYLRAYSANFDYFDFINYMLVKSYLNASNWISLKFNGLSLSLGSDVLSKYRSVKNLIENEQLRYSKKGNSYKRNSNSINIENLSLLNNSKIVNLNNYNRKFNSNEVDDVVSSGWTSSAKQVVPILDINIFGKIRASIGDDEVPQKFFSSSKIKLLLTILVIENGNEYNKLSIAECIWPNCNRKTQIRNINALCYRLKKILTISNGECPYIITSQNSYSLASELFKSDLQNLEGICEELTLGPINSERWSCLIKDNKTLFDGVLLPSEQNCDFIIQKREEYKNKIVDALISASSRLAEVKDLYQALWFAYRAISVDNTREDVYKNLMEIQISAGQRTSAVETYRACTRFLESKHKLKPSNSILSLYRQAICS